MKKIFLFGLLAFSIFPLSAQSFRFGAKGGFNYSDINGNQLDDNAHRSKLGWHAGLMVNIQYPGNTWFSIQPELLYSRKGYENHSGPSEVLSPNNTLLYTEQQGGLVRLNYLDLPVMFNFRAGILFFEAGPQFSLLIGYRNDAFTQQTFPDGSKNNLENPEQRFREEDINKLDVGIAAGLRLQTQNGAGIGMRFNQGFVKLPTHHSGVSGNQPTPPRANNQVFQVFVSYLIPE